VAPARYGVLAGLRKWSAAPAASLPGLACKPLAAGGGAGALRRPRRLA